MKIIFMRFVCKCMTTLQQLQHTSIDYVSREKKRRTNATAAFLVKKNSFPKMSNANPFRNSNGASKILFLNECYFNHIICRKQKWTRNSKRGQKTPPQKKKNSWRMSTHTRMTTWWFDNSAQKKMTFYSQLLFVTYSSNTRKQEWKWTTSVYLIFLCCCVRSGLEDDKKKWERKEKKNGLFVIILVVMYKSLEREMWTLLMLVHSLVSDVGTSTHFFSLSHLILVAHDDDASINNKKMKAIILYIKKWEEKYIYAS